MIWLLAVVLAAGLCSCSILPKEEQPLSPPVLKKYDPLQYNTYRVVRGDIQRIITISVFYVHTVTESLTFPVSGLPITKINVKKGDMVSKGDILAALDTTDIDGRLTDIEDQLTANKTAIENCKALYAIDKKIAVLTDNTEQAYIDYSTRLRNLETYRQSLELNRQLLEKKESERYIKAGMDGVISYIASIKLGDISQKNITAFVIDGSNTSVFAATDSNAQLLTDGMAVDLTVSSMSNQTYSAKVGNPASLGITEPKEGAAYMALEEPVTLPDNVYGSIKFMTDERKNVLYVPNQAVHSIRDRKFVYLINDNVKTVRDISIGLDTGFYIEVTGGLSEGDEIIVDKSY